MKYKKDLTWMTSPTFDTKSLQKFMFELQTSTLPLSEEGILHQSKFSFECFKLPFC